jgi:hypothetical protein
LDYFRIWIDIMSGSFQVLLAGIQPSVTVITTSGAGSTTAPIGYSSVTVEAIGGGGNGFGNNTTANRASGGGGQYAISNARLAVTGGTTIVYYQVGTAVQDSWVNVGTNAAPTAATTGCLAKFGTSGASGVAGSGAQAGSIGATTRNGGNGATGNNSQGGGGAGATTAGANPTAGTDTTGLSPTQLMGGGTGGAYNNATTSPGTAPGGGGGGAATTGTNYAGAIGRVRITFYP